MTPAQLHFTDHQPDPTERARKVQAGRRQRDIALSDLEQGQDVEWQARAYEALRTAAGLKRELTTDDVWSWLDRWGIDPPHEPKSMGVVVQRGVREGLIRAADRAPRASEREECHARPLRVWESLGHWTRGK